MIKTPEFHSTRVHNDYAECTCGWHSPHVIGDANRFAAWHRCAVSETIDNPYLRAFLAPLTEAEVAATMSDGLANVIGAGMRRDRLAAEYAWAIPTEGVLRKLAALSPICDLGCGTGYWAKLLRDVGAEVIAVDKNPPLEGNNNWHPQVAGTTLRHFVDVINGEAATFDVSSDQTLMLCWPPYDDEMASQALARYSGACLIYIGEGKGGCTGDGGFHAALDEQWKLAASYEIPQWNWIHDDVCVYVRRASETINPPTLLDVLT